MAVLVELERSVVLLEVMAVWCTGMAKDTACRLKLLWRQDRTAAQWHQRSASAAERLYKW